MRQIQDKFTLINLVKVELEDHRKLLNTLDLILFQLQNRYLDKLTYLGRSQNLMVFLSNINARLVSIWTGIICINIYIDKVYTYLDTLATHGVSPFLLPPSTLREIFENIKKGIVQHPQLALPNNFNQNIWSYYKLLCINATVFDNCLVAILQVLLVDKLLIMNVH